MVPSPVTVVPVSWSEHAYSEFGIRPQESLNKQLVEEDDPAFAMFADRLGTPTGEADPGTVEEMDVMREAGKHVSIVRSTSPCTLSGESAASERLRLEKYLSAVKAGRGSVYEYDTREDLASQVEHVLSSQAEIFLRNVGVPFAAQVRVSDDLNRGIWSRIEVTERAESDSRGRLRIRRDRSLVLQNHTGGVAKNVRYRYENAEGKDEESFDLRHERNCVQIMAPYVEQRFPILVAWQSAPEALCIVTWEDEDGEHETRATARR